MDSMERVKSEWRNRNVLITGATGFLGSWLTKSLVEKGASVVILVRDNVPRSNLFRFQPDLSKMVNQVNGDIEDYFLLERLLNEYEIEVIFHLAAQTQVTVANRNPVSTFETNIAGTWRLLEAARRTPSVKRIVLASSDKAYGDHEILPYDETSPLEGRHPYDVSKSCADLLCKSYHASFNLPVCVTRCGNFYGGGDLNFDRIVPGTIRSVYYNEPIIIRSDGTLIRDYFYVLDGVNAYIHLAEMMAEKEIAGQAFNFSNEIQLSVLELVKMILRVMEKPDHPVKILGEGKNEIQHQYLSATKAKEVLDWKPRYSIEKALSETVDWYVSFFKEYDKEILKMGMNND